MGCAQRNAGKERDRLVPKSWEDKFGDDLPQWQAVLLARRSHSMSTFGYFQGLELKNLGVAGRRRGRPWYCVLMGLRERRGYTGFPGQRHLLRAPRGQALRREMLPPHLDPPRRQLGRRVQARLPLSPGASLFLNPASLPPVPPTFYRERRRPGAEPRAHFSPRLRAQWSGPGGRLPNCELARRPRAGLAWRAPVVLRLAADRTGRRPHLRRDQ